MVERLAGKAVEPLEPRGHGARVGEHLSRLAESQDVHGGDRLARAAVLRGGGEVAVGGAELVVGLPVLVDEPDDLVGDAARRSSETASR